MPRPILGALQLEGEVFSLDIPSYRTTGWPDSVRAPERCSFHLGRLCISQAGEFRRVDSAPNCVPGSCGAASAALTQGSRFYCQVFSGFTARPRASIMWRAAALRSRRSSQRHHESTLRRHLPARPHPRCDTRLSHAYSHRTKSSHN